MNIITKLSEIIVLPLMLILNFLIWQSALIGILLGLVYLGFFSYLLGQSLFRSDNRCLQWLLGFIALVSIISLLGTVFFYLWELATLQIILTTILAPVLTIFLNTKPKQIANKKTFFKENNKNWPLIIAHYSLPILYLLITLKTFLVLYSYQTFAAIRTPWEVIPSKFFITYFILTLLLAFIIFNNKKSYNLAPINLVLISIHFLLTYSIVNIVYGINFGFDPFIHQATEKLLATTGTISPKPLLYIGQYSLVSWLAKISSLSLILVDKWLVPVLASLLLPATIFFALTKGFSIKSKTALLAILTFPIFLLPFYFSVPQNLANLFLLITILLSIILIKQKNIIVPFARKVSWLFLWLLGIFTFTIHPFSGIPLLIYLTIFTLLTQQKFHLSRKKIIPILIIVILLGLAVLPLALSVGSNLASNIDVSITSHRLPLVSGARDQASYQFVSWLRFYSVFHLAYLFKLNHVLILAVLAAYGLWMVLKNNKLRVTGYTLLITFFILSINTSLLNLIKLPIISYEIAEFTNRFWQIALLFLIPLILYALAKIIIQITSEKVFEQNIMKKNFNQSNSERAAERSITGKTLMQENKKGARALSLNRSSALPKTINNISIIFFIALFSIISLYLTYPRNDAFAKGRSFATSRSDITAVQWIEQDSGSRDYVVLANQAVSAAALQELGFKKYYPNQLTNPLTDQLFFYPIPTTSPTYQIYLDMVYQAPTKKRLQQALELTGAYNAYFVINDYWLDFDKIVEQAKLEFPNWQVIDNGRIYIFKLSR